MSFNQSVDAELSGTARIVPCDAGARGLKAGGLSDWLRERADVEQITFCTGEGEHLGGRVRRSDIAKSAGGDLKRPD